MAESFDACRYVVTQEPPQGPCKWYPLGKSVFIDCWFGTNSCADQIYIVDEGDCEGTVLSLVDECQTWQP